ncbi:hypothetical protein [Acidithiobacillus caldus]|uniref:Uncharacterized protein n=2 Tax=Acidithiobacillus caldus TaxID=33059 RepID=F9ZRY0_ACICS|nr:hypothetical protein [Acidithiobacillus caldus]AEK58765.1 hypothetical protein Atc_2117 [Acidithiobacillus caldus SM-1]OFC35527.1 hypothetical protein BAE29_15350 [Acidithiobacillus caldus]OFC36376.1 hypothetical protein BAE27_06250 [Acidithiobacillus caldus]OFC40442.1 hypothetical protein BAE28_00070 [Acidithiobacillus caldus]
MSARSDFKKKIEGLSSVGIHMVIDQLKEKWNDDDSNNAAVRRFIKICKEELQVRYELSTIPSEVAKRNAAIKGIAEWIRVPEGAQL